MLLKSVQVDNDQENAQSERNSHFKKTEVVKTKLTIRYLYLENIYIYTYTKSMIQKCASSF